MAVLRDSDLGFAEVPSVPGWAAAHDPDIVLIEHSHPTLEPAVTNGNETLVQAAIDDSHLDIPAEVDPQSVHELFRSARKATAKHPATPAGSGARHKGEFALALAARIADARYQGVPVSIPSSIACVLDFLYVIVPLPLGAANNLAPFAPTTAQDTRSATASPGSRL